MNKVLFGISAFGLFGSILLFTRYFKTKRTIRELEVENEYLKEIVTVHQKEINSITTPNEYMRQILKLIYEMKKDEQRLAFDKLIESLDLNDLHKISEELFYNIIRYQRGFLDFSTSDDSYINDWAFDIAVTWLLSDAMHNLPSAIDRDKWVEEDVEQYRSTLKIFISDCNVLSSVFNQISTATQRKSFPFMFSQKEIEKLVKTI